MRTSFRRAIALTGLTAVVIVSGSIAAADGTAVRDITDQALATAPAATVLPIPAPGDDLSRDVTPDREVQASPAAPDAEPRQRTSPDRGDRTAQEPGWVWRASWYGPGFHGNYTANGEVYDQWGLTAAHKTLPFGTRLRVTNVDNGRSVDVRINDRGPFIPGRDLDLSRGAANELGFSGVATVRVQEL